MWGKGLENAFTLFFPACFQFPSALLTGAEEEEEEEEEEVCVLPSVSVSRRPPPDVRDRRCLECRRRLRPPRPPQGTSTGAFRSVVHPGHRRARFPPPLSVAASRRGRQVFFSLSGVAAEERSGEELPLRTIIVYGLGDSGTLKAEPRYMGRGRPVAVCALAERKGGGGGGGGRLRTNTSAH